MVSVVAALSNRNDSLDFALARVKVVRAWVRNESDSLLSDFQIDQARGKELGGDGREDGDEVGRIGRVDGRGEDLSHSVERRLDGELAGHGSVAAPPDGQWLREWRTWAMSGSWPAWAIRAPWCWIVTGWRSGHGAACKVGGRPGADFR